MYNAVTYVDRYLSRQTYPVRKNELQLIGVAALFFSAKLEEIYPPKLVDFAYVTDSACTEVEIREMELIMLKVIFRRFLEFCHLATSLEPGLKESLEAAVGVEHANSGQLAQPLPPSRPVAHERGALSPTAVSAGDLCPNRSGNNERNFLRTNGFSTSS